MPTSTYEPIATYTAPSAQSSYTFTTVSTDYTDLILVFNGNLAVSDYVLLRVGNGSIDTGSNYSATRLIGNGSTATSGRSSSAAYIQFSDVMNTGGDNAIMHFQNYANTTTYKTVLSRTNTPITSGGETGTTSASVGLWRSTSAINTIQIYTYAGQNFTTGSTFTLYGIKAA
jgi:hypothetical protein